MILDGHVGGKNAKKKIIELITYKPIDITRKFPTKRFCRSCVLIV